MHGGGGPGQGPPRLASGYPGGDMWASDRPAGSAGGSVPGASPSMGWESFGDLAPMAGGPMRAAPAPPARGGAPMVRINPPPTAGTFAQAGVHGAALPSRRAPPPPMGGAPPAAHASTPPPGGGFFSAPSDPWEALASLGATAPHPPPTAPGPRHPTGLSEEQLARLFSTADGDADGVVAPGEAVPFLGRSGLPRTTLAAVWEHSATKGSKGLSREQFSKALALVAAAQGGMQVTAGTADVIFGAGAPSLPGLKLSGMEAIIAGSAVGAAPAIPGAAGGSWAAMPAPAAAPAAAPPPPSYNDVVASSAPLPPPYEAVAAPAPPAVPATTARPPGPPPMDLRPPPLLPKKAAAFTCLAGGGGSVFAAPGLPGGIRRWVAAGGLVGGAGAAQGRPPAGEPDAAPSFDMASPSGGKVLCMSVDEASGLLWAGLSDGRVNAWALGEAWAPGAGTAPVHDWQAHRMGGVTAIAGLPGGGGIVTGSKIGSLRAWQEGGYPTVGAAAGAAGGTELRRPGGDRAHAEVRHLVLAGREDAWVLWSGGGSAVALWDMSTGACLGSLSGITAGGKAGGAGGGGKEPNALKDFVSSAASKAVRSGSVVRAAVEKTAESGSGFMSGIGKLGKALVDTAQSAKATIELGTLGRDGSGLEAMAAGPGGGSVWVAYESGRLERYGTRGEGGDVVEACWEAPVTTCLLAVGGSQMWAGREDGTVRVYGAHGEPLTTWQAHPSPVASLALCGPQAVSLDAAGGVRAWWAAGVDARGEAGAARVREALAEGSARFSRREDVVILCGTWNVNEKMGFEASLDKWVGRQAPRAHVVVLGFQEIEMGGSSVAMAAVNEMLRSEVPNATGQWWAAAVEGALQRAGGPAAPGAAPQWGRVGVRQLSGMLVAVYARAEILPHIGEVETSAVACGVMGVGGNKGGAAVRFSLYRRKVCCVASHFAAHQNAVAKRNRDYRTIVAGIRFPSDCPDLVRRAEPAPGDALVSPATAARASVDVGKGMNAAELLIWAGDFNYRVDVPCGEAKAAVAEGRLGHLMERDQCRRELAAGRVFLGMAECPISFPPTYKFDKNTPDPLGYDSSEKQRVPSWTDRIFFRGSEPAAPPDAPRAVAPLPTSHGADSSDSSDDEDEDGGGGGFFSAAAPRPAPIPTVVGDDGRPTVVTSPLGQGTCLDVIESDHKPVYLLLQANLLRVDEAGRRAAWCEAVRAVAKI